MALSSYPISSTFPNLDSSIVAEIGQTPLIPLKSQAASPTIFVKHEGYNPGGSIYDRLLLDVIARAFPHGHDAAPVELVVAGATNCAVSAALIAHALGLKVTVFHPRRRHTRLLRLLREAQAKLVFSDQDADLDGARAAAIRYAAESEQRLLLEPELSDACAATCSSLVAEITSSLNAAQISHPGAIILPIADDELLRAASKSIRAFSPETLVFGVAVTSIDAHAPLYDLFPVSRVTAPQNNLLLFSELDAWSMRAEIARREGLLLGPSSAAAVAAAHQILRHSPCEQPVVVVALDGGQRYLTAMPAAISRALEVRADSPTQPLDTLAQSA